MAGIALVGSGRESYSPGFATRGARLGDPAGVAAGPVSRVEPGGSPVAPRERADLCESTIRVDRGTGPSLPPLPGGIIGGRGASEGRCLIRGLLVEIGIKDGHFMGLSPKRRQTVKKTRKKGHF